MRIAAVKYVDVANGPGCRTSVFVSGCRRGCPGCFNQEAQDFAFGQDWTPELCEQILASLEPAYVTGLTLLGGEPFEPENQRGLAELARAARERVSDLSLWCYTGFTIEQLTAADSPVRSADSDELLGLIDVLVDGPFIQGLRDVTLRFRGSSNQRLLDLPATLHAGVPVPWRDEQVYATHAW
jgi:anaerobic ribonucleoside-triphosphate reductase activating protein